MIWCNAGHLAPPASKFGLYVKTSSQRIIGDTMIKYSNPKIPSSGQSGAMATTQENM